MQKLINRLALSVLFIMSSFVYSQVDNGDFEYVDSNLPIGNNGHRVDYAVPWKTLNSSPDVHHPDTPWTPGLVNTNGYNGVGFMALGYNEEYAYGRTQPLVAGQDYIISFRTKGRFDYSQFGKCGVQIVYTEPNANLFNGMNDFEPDFMVETNSSTYTEGSFCFTAPQSGVAYLIFGTKGREAPFNPDIQFVYVDDVSIVENNNTSNLNSSITANSTSFCIGDDIILDGTNSSNEDEYFWHICQVDPNSGEHIQHIYNQPVQNGTAGLYSVSNMFNNVNHFPQTGNCYRAYLQVNDQICSSQDYIDFCYEDVDVDFLNNENAVCEGTPIDLEVTGDNNWTYEWSTGESGQGEDFKTIEVIPTGNSATYSVTVTTPNGCTVTESINFTVHSQNNQAPWMNGINGSGEYTLYVNTDPGPTDQISFTSDIFNDNANESFGIVSITENFPQGTFYNITPNGNSSISFNWNYGSGLVPDVPPGEYSFTVFLEDNNKCNKGENDFTFIIKLICENCPECITYEDRSSSTTPLPPETEAARCIKAGFSQTVDTENEDVYFQAGESIDLGPYFEAGPGYEGVIEPTTCVTDCEDCCINWEGFTYDDIAEGVHEEPDGGLFDVVFMDFLDNDPTNDIFQLTDVNNPYCAYNALGYDLSIIYGYDEVIYQKSFNADNCCNFVSPSPDNPIPHASIWWDGYVNQGSYFGDFPRVDELNLPSGLVRYEITLYGCDGATELIVGFINVNPNGSKMNTGDESSNGRMNETLQQSIERRIELEKAVKLSPNPTRSKVTISGVAATEISSIKIYDDKGIIVQYEKEVDSGQVSLENLKPGTYYCKIKVNGLNITKKFVKL